MEFSTVLVLNIKPLKQSERRIALGPDKKNKKLNWKLFKYNSNWAEDSYNRTSNDNR